MRNSIFIVFALFLLLGLQTIQVNAQCPNDNNFWLAVGEPPCQALDSLSVGGGTFVEVTVNRGNSYSFNTCGSPFDIELSGYEGANTTSVFYNNDNGPACTGTSASVDWVASFDGTLRIVVDQVSCTWSSQSAVLRYKNNGPANDECVNAIQGIGDTLYHFDNHCATGTDLSSCGFNDFTDIWYRYDAPCNGNNVVFSLCGPSTPFDPSLSIFTGTCGNFSQVACNDDACGVQSQIIFNVTGGTTYHIRIAGFNGDLGSGDFIIANAPVGLDAPDPIIGADSVCRNATDIVYSINPVPGAIGYAWTVPAGIVIVSGQGTTSIVVDFIGNPGTISVSATSACGNGPATTLSISFLQGLPVPDITQNVDTLTCTVTATNYQWFKDGVAIPGAVQQVYIYPNGGTFTVLITDDNGCQSESLPYYTGCPEPVQVWTANITPSSARINWTPVLGAFKYTTRIRIQGNTNWVVNNIAASVTSKLYLGLPNQTTLEWQMRTVCDFGSTDSSEWTPLQTFTTGCKMPILTWTNPIACSGAKLNWTHVPGRKGYEIQIREVGAANWNNLIVGPAHTEKAVFGLLGATTYEWQIRTLCDLTGTVTSPYTSPISFLTQGNNCRMANSGQQEKEALGLTIIPNPFSSTAKVKIAVINGQRAELNVYDLTGRRVQAYEVAETGEVVITRDQLEPGIYILELAGERVIREKLIIE